MANTPSAKKRVKQNARNYERNRARKSMLKTETRKLLTLIHDGKLDEAKQHLRHVHKKLDQVAAKGTLHANTAARKKSRLAARLNKAVAGAK